jgi:RND superfamily putative drug exporter
VRRIAEFVLRHRLMVFSLWVVLIIAGFVAAGATNKRLVIDFSLPGQPGTEAAHKIIKDFGNGGQTSPYIISVTAPEGQKITGNEAAVGKTFAATGKALPNLRVIDEATSGDNVFRTDNDRTAYAYVFYPPPHSAADAALPTDDLTAATKAAAPAGWTVGVTGEDPLAAGDSSGGGNSVLAESLLGALGALIVLGFVFASFLAFLPLIVALASIMLTFLFLLPLTYATDMSFIVQFLVALIGLGVAIDYSLLLVTRWREERDHGRDNHEAVIVAMETAGRAVVFSGVTVAIGLISLVVLPVPFMRSIGIGGALIPLASVLTTLTLTPVILGSIGPKIDWPKIRHENTASRGWAAWARTVVHHRVLSACAAALVLIVLIGAFFGIKIGLSGSDSLAKTGPAYTAFQQLKDGGQPAGILTPLQVLATTDGAKDAGAQISKVHGIHHVVVSTDPGNVANGNTMVVAIPVQETANSSTVGPVREVKKLADSNPAIIGVAGPGADQIDFLKAVYGNFPLMLLVISLLTFVLLARGFRSVLLPIKAILLNLFTLAATLGFMVLFWQKGHGSETIFNVHSTGAVTFWVPIMVFAFLFGLSMDYEVFILARIREEYERLGDTDEAVVQGIARTGRLVTSAALILFLAFVALATGPGTDLKIFATALGFGILLDATVVRSLLVPALVSMFGNWNWWMPAWFAKILRVEPTKPRAAGTGTGVPEGAAAATATE